MNSPNLNLTDVRNEADKFIHNYHPSLELPIPIDEIVELKMKIAIVAVPGIKSLLGVDSFINRAFNQITIDEYSYDTYVERTRFSIAHEIGHFVLHRQWYEKNGPMNLDDFMEFFDRIDRDDYKYLEIQAQTFAGFILVPTIKLNEEIKQKIGYVPELEPSETFTPIFQDLLNKFQVSGDVMLKRLIREKIIKANL